MSEAKRSGRPSQKGEYFEEVKRLYLEEKHSLSEIADVLPVSIQTLSRWLQSEGVPLEVRKRNPNAGRTPEQQAAINAKISRTRSEGIRSGRAKAGGRSKEWSREERTCPTCHEGFVPRTRDQRFCGVQCARQSDANRKRAATEAAWYASEKSRCACGGRIPYAFRDTWKYCSPECRVEYGSRRQPDPANYITFNCDTCGIEVTRLKNYGSSVSGKRFCSNACAMKHTKVVKHYVVAETDMVLDSGWEMLFAGLCYFQKIPCERYDRSKAVEWSPGRWYAPDFYLPSLKIAVEVKGIEDSEDQARWAQTRTGLDLVVLDQTRLDLLRKASDPSDFIRLLGLMAAAPSPEPVLPVEAPAKG